jgi:hypothetical protein
LYYPFLKLIFVFFLLYLIIQNILFHAFSKSLGALRRCTNLYEVVYIDNGNDSVAGLSGARSAPDHFDYTGFILIEANYFDLHPPVYVAAELYACFCLVGVIMSADTQDMTECHV